MIYIIVWVFINIENCTQENILMKIKMKSKEQINDRFYRCFLENCESEKLCMINVMNKNEGHQYLKQNIPGNL